jgi:hypothetical protein
MRIELYIMRLYYPTYTQCYTFYARNVEAAKDIAAKHTPLDFKGPVELVQPKTHVRLATITLPQFIDVPDIYI